MPSRFVPQARFVRERASAASAARRCVEAVAAQVCAAETSAVRQGPASAAAPAAHLATVLTTSVLRRVQCRAVVLFAHLVQPAVALLAVDAARPVDPMALFLIHI